MVKGRVTVSLFGVFRDWLANNLEVLIRLLVLLTLGQGIVYSFR